MAKGWDDYKNGLIFGVIFGLVVLYAAVNIDTGALNWVDSLITSLTDWLQGIESMPTFLVELTWLNYVVAGLIGGIVGIYIDVR